MKPLKIGITSYEKMKTRTMAIARGQYTPGRSEPKVWFTSMESFARVLSDRNRALLGLIAQAEPESITELASLSGREKSNLSRTLKTLEHYGLVRLKKCPDGKVTPRVPYSDIVLDMPIVTAGTTATVATPV
jgi:predicted transcriptional regulator